MLGSRRTSLALLASCLFMGVLAPEAPASGPATVTVRVEGQTETKLPATQVTTTTTPVVKDGNPADSCAGTSAAGALEAATAGNWSGKWYSGLGYAAETVLGESHPFGSGSFWDVWIDNAEATGFCEVEMSPGDQLLLFPCEEAAPECPTPLGIEAPATANVGESFPVTVKSYNAKGQASPVMGASVTGAERATDSSGHTTAKLPSAGEISLHATMPGLVRAETTVCVHNGNDGTCGTAAAPGPGTTLSTTTTVAPATVVPYTGPYAVVAFLKGLRDGHTYGRRAAPRLLRGMVDLHAPLSDVRLRLTRRQGQDCAFYDGVTERFRAMRCGAAHGSFFSVGDRASFSYPLPSALAFGRYVLDVEASDTAGNHTALARGTSRIVFYVR